MSLRCGMGLQSDDIVACLGLKRDCQHGVSPWNPLLKFVAPVAFHRSITIFARVPNTAFTQDISTPVRRALHKAQNAAGRRTQLAINPQCQPQTTVSTGGGPVCLRIDRSEESAASDAVLRKRHVHGQPVLPGSTASVGRSFQHGLPWRDSIGPQSCCIWWQIYALGMSAQLELHACTGKTCTENAECTPRGRPVNR